ncbi:sulfatase [Pleomorphovibrio marinus]|uniref:sulfatase n=1 Tax=Pleomorphovibrio marinus TaxID=2164132 RepID=UPI000E0C588B|nr:sulfatase [Pleomorphovibrio marinus]
MKYTTSFLALLLLFGCKSADSDPNIIFIVVDDLGWADITPNWPDTFYETPNLDRLAKMGVRFSQAYSAHPVCSPTRAALMTGKHPNRVGITDWIPGSDPFADERPLSTPGINHNLALEEVTIAERVKEKGYDTYFVGKWHLGEEPDFWPENQGFDVNIGGWSAGAPQLSDGKYGGYFSPYGNPRLEDGPEGEFLTNRLMDESLELIRASDHNPFLLYLSFYTVHTPIQAVPHLIEKFRRKREDLGEIADHQAVKQEGEGITQIAQTNAEYASMVAAMDEQIGRLLDELESSGKMENTWIVFTSDNGGLSTRYNQGGPTANGPLRAGKGWCYEGGIRVPLIIAGPGVLAGPVVDHPVVSMDLFATAEELANLEVTAQDGKSLLGLLRGQEIEENDIFWHYPHYHGSAWKPGSAIRSGNWKLIYTYEDQKISLYELAQDEGETTDLALVYPEIAEVLLDAIHEKMEDTGGKYPTWRKEEEGEATFFNR